MQPLRLGFIGAGEMALHTTYPSLHFAPIRLEAVCDLDPEKARFAASKFGSPYWYQDSHKMLAQDNLEAVIIQMHPRLRQALVREALDAGLHVFIPKPPAMNLTDTIQLAQCASRTGKTVMVNFQRRFSFGVQRARELMSSPAFGQVTQLSCSFCSGTYDVGRGRHYDGPVHAFVLDFAVHHLDLARFLGGEVRNLSLYHRELDGGVAIAISLQFAGGAVGTLQLNSHRIWWRNYDRIEITGRGEYVVVDGLWQVRHYTSEHNSFTENYSDQRSGELTGDAFSLQEFVAAIRQRRPPQSSIQDAVPTMQIYQAVYDAILAGRQGSLSLPDVDLHSD